MGNNTAQLEKREVDPFDTRTDLSREAVGEISSAPRRWLDDVFALYLKANNFHWHMSGRHFRDYRLLLDEHARKIFAMTDDIAERARKIGAATLRSISDISRDQRLKEVCKRHSDIATASLIETWIDQTERRTWFLSEIARPL